MRHDAESLRAELAAAFAERQYPGDDAIAYQREGCSGYEGNEAREWLRGKTWRDLLAEGMGVEHRDYVNFLRPEGWLYYFPALATFALDLEHPAEMDETLTIKLAWAPHEVMHLLTPAERRAVVHLLEYVADAHDERGYDNNLARYALDTHWASALDESSGGDLPAPVGQAAGLDAPRSPRPAPQENGDAVS